VNARHAAAALLLLGLLGCASTPDGIKNILPDALKKDERPVIAQIVSTDSKERNWAAESEADLFSRRVSEYVVPFLPAERYLNELLDRVRKASPVPELPAKVYLTSKMSLAADSTEGHNIYISLGWLESVDSEEELLVLLAHEFGHLALRHHDSDGFFNAQKRLKILSAFIMSTANQNSASVGADKLSTKNKRVLNNQEILIQLMDALVHPMWKREQEVAADKFARDILSKLQISAKAQIAFFDRLAKDEEQVALAKKDAPVKVDTDFTLGGVLQSALDELKSYQHPKAEDRANEIAEYADKFYSEVRKEPKSSSGKLVPKGLDTLRKSPQFVSLQKNYKAALEAESAYGNEDYELALKKARLAVAKPTENHAYPLTELLKALLKEGPSLKAPRQIARNRKEIDDTWRRIARLEERSWTSYAVYFDNTSDSLETKQKVLEESFRYFREAPVLQVHRVTYYSKWGNSKKAEELAGVCAMKSPEYRDLCHNAAKKGSRKS